MKIARLDHLGTTIGREYAIATALGFSLRDLVSFTRNSIQASFTSAKRRRDLLNEVQSFESLQLGR